MFNLRISGKSSKLLISTEVKAIIELAGKEANNLRIKHFH